MDDLFTEIWAKTVSIKDLEALIECVDRFLHSLRNLRDAKVNQLKREQLNQN